jgi:hypothetical protein
LVAPVKRASLAFNAGREPARLNLLIEIEAAVQLA